MSSSKEKAAAAAARHERYLGHVKRLEEEVVAAKAHADQAASELAATHRESSQAERRLVAMQSIRTLDDGIDTPQLAMLHAADEALKATGARGGVARREALKQRGAAFQPLAAAKAAAEIAAAEPVKRRGAHRR